MEKNFNTFINITGFVACLCVVGIKIYMHEEWIGWLTTASLFLYITLKEY